MKTKLLYLLSFLLILPSCSRDDREIESKNFSHNLYPQEWVLFKAVVGLSGEVLTDDDLVWQEEYVFNKDNSFTKVRTYSEDTLVASGSFQLQQDMQKAHLILTFDDGNSIVNSCGDGNREFLLFKPKSNVLENSGWSACDGPGLYYKIKT